MREEVKVTVVEFSDRKHYQMQWRCPVTGRKKTKSTGVERTGRKRDRHEAERIAGEHEKALREGRYKPASKVTWGEFRRRYEDEALSGKADGTYAKACGVFNSLEEVLGLSDHSRLTTLTESRLSFYQAELRKAGRSEDTIRGHLAHLGAALQWAVRVKMLREAPSVEMPTRIKGDGKVMKGRAVTGEEFDRLLEKVEEGLIASCERPPKRDRLPPKRQQKPETIEKRRREQQARAAAAAPSWKRFLRGLWLSGLRLGEALELYWDRDDRLCVDLSGRRPMLWIPGALQKSGKDTLLPITPDFAEFLLATPEAERTGPVFRLEMMRPSARRPTLHRVSRIISAIGEAAGVKVNTDAKTGAVKFASAHDLRRSFGERWASRVMPAVLKELMRHDSVDTTLKFYVGINAERTADAVWQAFEKAQAAGASNTLGNTGQKETPSKVPGGDGSSLSDSVSEVVRGGIEPPTHGFSGRVAFSVNSVFVKEFIGFDDDQYWKHN